MPFTYTPEMLSFIETGYKQMSVVELTAAFNERFSTEKTRDQIKGQISRHKFKCGRSTGHAKKGKSICFTDEQIAWLTKAYKIHGRPQLPALFEKEFGEVRTYTQIVGFLKRRKIKAGRTGHFKAGVPSWSAGTKGVLKANSGSFKKNQVPHNYVPVGSYRITSYGYPQYKMAEPNVWENESALMWKAHRGDIPDGMKIYHLDGDKLNTHIDNLALVDNAESMNLTHLGVKNAPLEFKESVLLIAKINAKASSIERGL